MYKAIMNDFHCWCCIQVFILQEKLEMKEYEIQRVKDELRRVKEELIQKESAAEQHEESAPEEQKKMAPEEESARAAANGNTDDQEEVNESKEADKAKFDIETWNLL